MLAVIGVLSAVIALAIIVPVLAIIALARIAAGWTRVFIP